VVPSAATHFARPGWPSAAATGAIAIAENFFPDRDASGAYCLASGARGLVLPNGHRPGARVPAIMVPAKAL
jgi:hypothetical protein